MFGPQAPPTKGELLETAIKSQPEPATRSEILPEQPARGAEEARRARRPPAEAAGVSIADKPAEPRGLAPASAPVAKPAPPAETVNEAKPETGILSGREKGGISPELPTLDTGKFWHDDIARKIANAAHLITETSG